MRVRLGSPQDGGETPFDQAAGTRVADVLMEDRLLEVEIDDVEGIEDSNTEDDRRPVYTLLDFRINTSEELVRRLKGKADGGQEGDSKLNVAKAAFSDTVVPVAKKEVLLLEWLLDVLVKDAKDLELKLDRHASLGQVGPPAKVEYWTLLALCSRKVEPVDLAALANRFAAPSLLLVLCSDFKACQQFPVKKDEGGPTVDVMLTELMEALVEARTSRQALSIDTIHHCLSSWFAILYSREYENGNETRETLHGWRYADQDGRRRNSAKSHEKILKIILDLWCIEVKRSANHKKAIQFFCDQFLTTSSRLLYYLKGKVNPTSPSAISNVYDFPLLQTLLHRVSYECICIADHFPSTQQKVLEAIRNSESAYSLHFPSLYIQQICAEREERQPKIAARRNDHTSLIQEKEWKDGMLQSFIGPAIEIIIEGTVRETCEEEGSGLRIQVESLKALLQAVSTCGMYLYDEENRSASLLAKIVKFTLSQYRRASTDTGLEMEKNEIQLACLDVMLEVHRLDESILIGDLRYGVIVCALDRPAIKDGLLDLICNTSMKSREVVALVRSILETIELSAGVVSSQSSTNADSAWQTSTKGVSETFVTTALLDRKFWQRTLGVAIRDFISPEQTMELLDTLQTRLLRRFSDVYSVSTRKRKRVDGVAEGEAQRGQMHNLAIMDTYFACQLLGYLSIPRPVHQEAQEKLQSLQVEGIEACLVWGLEGKADPRNDSLTTAVLVLHDSVQQLCNERATEEYDQANQSWLKAATKWDTTMDDRKTAFQSIVSGADQRLPELQIQVHLSIIKRVERAMQRNESSVFTQLLANGEGGNFEILSEIDFGSMGEQRKEGDVPFSSAQWLHGLGKNDCILVLWDVILSQHLATFELLASFKLLSRLAKAALKFTEHFSLLNEGHARARDNLIRNGRNLELRRWREALCHEMKVAVSEEAKDAKLVMKNLADFVMITRFPVEWFPLKYLAEIWSTIFGRIKDTTWIYRHASSSQLDRSEDQGGIEIHLMLLYEFLADCLEQRRESLGVSLGHNLLRTGKRSES
ncbi:hypothetical protein CBS101457_002049 [Exobasidium rhododendri]|nr:hypothetical protein CBS101457_002049 [Exobasidium rhododendri]